MERDFLGLSSKKESVIVQEDAADGFKSSGSSLFCTNKFLCSEFYMRFLIM